MPPGKDAQCNFCQQKDISFIAKTGYGLSSQAGKLLDADHVVYLAYFSDDTIKVGVSLWQRREIRVTEQGAIACVFIAKCSGTMARNLEKRIRTTIGFTEWVRLSTKLKALCKNEPSETKAKRALEAAFEKVVRLAPSSVLFDAPEFYYLFPRYGVSSDVFSSDIFLVKKASGGSTLSGTLKGILGKMMLIGCSEGVVACNSALLAGYSMSPAKSDDGMSRGIIKEQLSIDRQQTMFDLL